MIYLFSERTIPGKKSAKTTNDQHLTAEFIASQSMIRQIDIDKELNTIPITDAFLLNENNVKRSLLKQSLNDNTIQNLDILKLALENEDSETAHYAASAMLEIKRKTLSSLQEFSEQVKNSPDDFSLLASYADALKQSIEIGVLDSSMKKKYMHVYSDLLGKILSNHSTAKEYFIDKINYDLQLKQYSKAKQYCEIFIEKHSFEEMPFLLFLKYYFQIGDSESFQKMLNKLKKSPVRLSSTGLEMVRFWL
ncbi:hypothetical protein [Bacillus sp. V5-8f]|uniref:hypothetical protein n=1 Tax=Bacillus sp. V5-8f TaxID=2053044 RepID=UPI00115C26FB|nr:hypothetical protein [Bacillus sp. V5-8f]